LSGLFFYSCCALDKLAQTGTSQVKIVNGNGTELIHNKAITGGQKGK
jgi:hypothetical protein